MRPIVAAVAVAILLPAMVTTPVARAACGTNWHSKTVPPDTIRVLRHETGKVKVADFREYVGIVMASGEWPNYLPKAALEAGAVAVKQFAWYYALEGHHRDWYVTDDGVCYDVRDDTMDQLYKPGSREPGNKQLDAIAATWNITLRKNGRFFLTGYRYGDDVPCASDTNGWKLFERSVVDCADRGWTSREILKEYYRPVDIISNDDNEPSDDPGDRDAPTTSRPQAGFKQNATFGKGTTLIAWSGQDAGTGIARFRLQQKTDGGRWRRVDLADPRQERVRLNLAYGHTYRFRVKAVDKAGNASDWKVGAAFVPVRYEDTSARPRFQAGKWTTHTTKAASGDTTRYAVDGGSTASLTFTGRAVALVAPRGVERGEAHIRIDGQHVATIDLRRDVEQARKVVFEKRWNRSATHTIEVVVAGTGGRPRVDVDAFLVFRDPG